MNILQIRYFVAVADNMSFTMASRQLFVSQPSISKNIAALEDELGLKLFDRSGKKLCLTNSGELLYHDFKILLSNIDSIVQKAHDIGDSVVGRLRIGIMRDMNISKITQGRIAEFVEKYPLIKLEFTSGTGEELNELCAEDKIDCMFVLDYIADVTNSYTPIDALPVYHAPSRIVFKSGYFDTDTPTPKHLNDTPYIIMSASDRSAIMSQTALAELSDSGINPSDIIWVDSLDTLLLNANLGFGVGIIGPTIRVPDDYNLICMPLPNANKDVIIKLCWKTSNNSPFLAMFRNGFE